MSIAEALAAARERLRDSESPRPDATVLLAATLGRDAAWLLAHDTDGLDAEGAERYRLLIERRAAGEPVAYLIGSAGFYGRTFAVTPDVLVPRPETEHLVALALSRLAACDDPVRICDAGTGSGILAITLALERPRASVTAIDVSPAALVVARRNATALGVADRIAFCAGDALHAVEAGAVFDAIVANLPYVRTPDLAPWPDPTAFEPRLALDGGADGLDIYRRLLADAPGHLATRGTLLMEAGPDTAAELARLARRALARSIVTVHDDYAGRERIVEVRHARR